MPLLRGVFWGCLVSGMWMTNLAMWNLVNLGDDGRLLMAGVSFFSAAIFVAAILLSLKWPS